MPLTVPVPSAVVPLKESTRLFPAPSTPPVKVPSVPVSVTVAAPSVTRPL